MKRILIFLWLWHVTFFCIAQDTVVLKEVTVNAYLGQRPVLRMPASVTVIDSNQLQKQPGQSPVPVFNTVPGVRMEERSPGSYRLSIRNSSLRSPFGIRNTKVYIDEFALTNAGGETYLNLMEVSCMNSFEILKGPDGSLFGANSVGVVRVKPVNDQDSTHVSLGLQGGSYGRFGENLLIQKRFKKNVLSIAQAWQKADGYRQNSALDRKYFHLANSFNYAPGSQLRVFFLYSDLYYQTPGALTLAQYQADPKQARPATTTLPGALEQKTAIANKTFFGGIVNELKLTNRLKHVISVFGSTTHFENPFITNYEIREEKNGGARTWLEFLNKNTDDIRLTFNVGGELQYQSSDIYNYGNKNGVRDALQINDHVNVLQTFGFARAVSDFYNKFILEASVSYNYNEFNFTRQFPFTGITTKKIQTPQLMPRAAASYLLNKIISIRGIVSRGYSPPSLQEIRSSSNEINLSIQPEFGWNYEMGTRLRTANGRLWWDASVYYYELSSAIVRRLNAAGQEYFVNAGNVFQSGFESQLRTELIRRRNSSLIRGLELSNAYTLNYYKFGNYNNGTSEITGNDLTGVPRHVSVTGITMQLPCRFYFFGQHNYTYRIPLNDVNSEFSKEYNLVQVKAGWASTFNKKIQVNLSAGIDNLLNEKYSLGNDLNAAANRFYNAAPTRNYFFKAAFTI